MGNDREINLLSIKKMDGFSLPISCDACLKPLYVNDITSSYVEGLNDPEVNRFLIGPRREKQTFETVAVFVEANEFDPSSILFGLYINNQLSGTCRLHDITNTDAYLGLAIFLKAEWGKGYAAEMIMAVCNFARDYLGINQIKAGIELENHGSRRAFEKAGFTLKQEEGKAETWIKDLLL